LRWQVLMMVLMLMVRRVWGENRRLVAVMNQILTLWET
jgi:hypothetical protein